MIDREVVHLLERVSELARAINRLADRINNDGGSRPLSDLATKHDLEEMEKRIMATLKDLDDEIQTDLNDAATGIENALTAALAKITVPPDVQPQIDHIKAIAAALKTAAAGSVTTVNVPPAP